MYCHIVQRRKQLKQEVREQPMGGMELTSKGGGTRAKAINGAFARPRKTALVRGTQSGQAPALQPRQ